MSDINITIRLASKAAQQGLDQFGNSSTRASNKLKGLQLIVKNTQGAFNSFIGNLGAVAVQRAIGGLVNGIGAAVTNMREFETALVGVGKTTGLSGKRLQDLGREIENLSTEIPVAATELLGLGQTAAQLGIKGSDNILKFTETMARLAVSTDVVGEQGAIAFARIINVTGESVENIDKLGDSLVVLGNNFAATESQILTVANEVAKGGARFGLTAEQVLGMSTAMSALGTEAQVAGSTIQKVFSQVELAIGQGGDELAKFTKITGLSDQALINLFNTQPDKFFQKLVEGLGNSVKDGTNLSSTLAELGFQDLRVTKTLGPLITRTDLLADAMDKATDATFKNGALNKESDAVFKTLDSDLKILDNTWKAFTNTIVRLVLPAITSIVKATSELIGFINESAAAQGILVGLAFGVTVLTAKVVLASGAFTALTAAASTAWLAVSGPLIPIVLGVAAVTAAVIKLNNETDKGRLARLKESRANQRQGGNLESINKEISLLEDKIAAQEKVAKEDAKLQRLIEDKKRGQEGLNSVLAAGTKSTREQTIAEKALNGVLQERTKLAAGENTVLIGAEDIKRNAQKRLQAEIAADAEAQRIRIENDKKALKRLEVFGELENKLRLTNLEKRFLADGKVDAKEELRIQEEENRLAIKLAQQQAFLQKKLGNDEAAAEITLKSQVSQAERENAIIQKQVEIRKAAQDEELRVLREVGALKDQLNIVNLEKELLADGELTAREDLKIQEEADRLATRLENQEIFLLEQQGKQKEADDARLKAQIAQGQRELAIDKQKSNAQLNLEKTFQNQKNSILSSSFGLAAALAKNGSKAQFLIQKAAAIAEIQIARGKAIALVPAQTALIPYPANIGAAAQLTANANIQAAIGTATVIASAIQGFQDGGVVGGSSFSGDNVLARVNSGEMILNREQQSQLFSQANGQSESAGGGGGDVVVQIDGEEVFRAVSRQVANGSVLGEGGV